MRTREESEALLKVMTVQKLRDILVGVHRYVPIIESFKNGRDWHVDRIIECELDRRIIVSTPAFSRYTLDSNPIEQFVPELSERGLEGAFILKHMLHDEYIYERGVIGDFIGSKTAQLPLHLLGLKDRFIKTLMLAGGDAALAILRMRVGFGSQWNALSRSHGRFLQYVKFADKLPNAAITHRECLACRFTSVNDEEIARVHIGACKRWAELDELASKLFFTDWVGLNVMMDWAEEQNVFGHFRPVQ